MQSLKIEAAPREVGKKATKAVRRAGNVPCILYGHGVEPVAVQVPEPELRPLIYTSEMHVLSIDVDGTAYDCIMKEVDFHPVTDRVRHADLQVLKKGEMVTLMVPVQYHGTPVGQKEGGDTQFLTHEVEIRCLPKDIPSHIDVDIAELTIGDSIHIGDLNVEGVEFGGADDTTIVTVVPPRLVALPEEEEEAALALEGEEGEAAEGEEDESADESDEEEG